MFEVEKMIAICDELTAAFAEVARDGKAHEKIDELIAASERAATQMAEIVTVEREKPADV